ncbi:hypothetical protein BJV82DRAFT_674143 [Fennellomyces sp. T-0311]|nr:hypothetical protein BJV82DRAFT_674143 [Fennellomyces sp. T-0311]
MKRCHLRNDVVVTDGHNDVICLVPQLFLQRSLHPLVALDHFLVEQKTSIIDMAIKDDPTIKALYEIAKRVFEDETALDDTRQDAIDAICDKAISRFNRAISLLDEGVSNSETRKRISKCFTNGLDIMEALLTKHTALSSRANTSTTEDQAANRND